MLLLMVASTSSVSDPHVGVFINIHVQATEQATRYAFGDDSGLVSIVAGDMRMLLFDFAVFGDRRELVWALREAAPEHPKMSASRTSKKTIHCAINGFRVHVP